MKLKTTSGLFFVFLIFLSAKNNFNKKQDDQIFFKSSAFAQLTDIPIKYTCEGENISPPLVWDNFPKQSKSVAIVCLDPDAKVPFAHWVLYNIPVEWKELPENFSLDIAKQRGVLVGKNDFGKLGYGGPCPPKEEHRYYFQLFILNDMLKVKEGLSKNDLMYAMRMNVISKKVYIGKYKKSK